MPYSSQCSLKFLRCLIIVLFFVPMREAGAQDRFFLQLEAGQGLIFAPGVDPYTFSAQIHPSLGLGASPKNFMLGGSLAAVYDNPDWVMMWGGRVVLHAATLKKQPVTRGPRVTYGTLHFTGAVLLESAEVRRIAGGLSIDVWEGALLISPRVGYDKKFEKTFLEVGLGMSF
jgi:hypothetical protein